MVMAIDKKRWEKIDVPIEYSGRAITLPETPGKMPLDAAIEALVRKREDENQIFKVFEKIDAFPTDAAVAFVKAMNQLYGWASPQTQQTFWGKQPPTMLSIKTGPGVDEVIQCPLGAFKLPGCDEQVLTGIHPNIGFYVSSEIKKRDKDRVLEIVTLARQIVREASIYRGKPVVLHVDDDGNLVTGIAPEFMDVSDMTEASVMFDQDIMNQIYVNVLVPLKETQMCRAARVPLKRTVLLEGKYGTGKSLTARLVARVAQDNGWTFVLIEKAQALKATLEFVVNRYAPAVVFCEDIDRIMHDRDDKANDLINTIDGVVSKRSEVMTILTTNHIDQIHPVMLRPGRLDAVVSLKAPDAGTVEKLLRYYAGDRLPFDENLKQAGTELAGLIPAAIRECVERAKLGMISRKDTQLAGIDIVIAAQSMKAHMALLNPKPTEASIGDVLANSLRKVVTNGAHPNVIQEMNDTIIEIRGQIG